MKKLFYLLLLSPMMAFSQASPDYLMLEIGTLSVAPANVNLVEAGLAAHNKKYHAAMPSGVRVYTVESGKNSGDYKWVMGPAPWASLDNRPKDDAHNLDWDANVARNLGEDGNNEYIRLDPAMSRFPNDFNVDKLFIRYVDVVRGKMDKFNEIMKKIHRVYAEKIPNETFGVFYNEVPSTSSGRDVTIVSYFNSWAWMAQDDMFNAKYDEIFGKGSAEAMWSEWNQVTVGQECEIWEYHENLSGLGPQIKAADRQ